MPSVGLKFYEWLNVESAVNENACCFVNTLHEKRYDCCVYAEHFEIFCESKQKSFRLRGVLRIFIEMGLPDAGKERMKNKFMKITG